MFGRWVISTQYVFRMTKGDRLHCMGKEETMSQVKYFVGNVVRIGSGF
jgi:hypothetical protein